MEILNGGLLKGNFRTFPQGKYQVTKKSFLSELLYTNNSVDRNDAAEKESCGQETCGQQASGLLRL